MEAFVLTIFILQLIAVPFYVIALGWGDFDKPVYSSRGKVLFNLLFSTAFAVWSGILVF